MSRVFLYLFRFAVIVLGFFAAALAASAFLHLLYLGAAGQGAQALAFEGMEPLALSVPLVALVLANFAFLPALAVILIAELTGRRDWLFHALGGAVVTVLAVAGAVAGLAPIRSPAARGVRRTGETSGSPRNGVEVEPGRRGKIPHGRESSLH